MNEAMPILIICGCSSVLGIVISALAFRFAAKTMKEIDKESKLKTDKKE